MTTINTPSSYRSIDVVKFSFSNDTDYVCNNNSRGKDDKLYPLTSFEIVDTYDADIASENWVHGDGKINTIATTTTNTNDSSNIGMEKQQQRAEPTSWLMKQLSPEFDSSSSSSLSSLSSSSSSTNSSRNNTPCINRKSSSSGSNNKKCTNFFATENTTKHNHWSEEEDEKLKVEVNKFLYHHHGASDGGKITINWDRISMSTSFRRTRSSLQCKHRWIHSLQPGINHGRWEKYDDDFIIYMISQG